MTAAAFVLMLSLSGQSARGAASAPPATSTAATAQSYFLYLEGRDLEDAGKIDDAIAAFTQAIALAPEASGVHAELAALYARAGRAGESVSEAQAALALNPSDRDAHRSLGLVQAAVAEQGSSPAQAASLMTQAIDHLAQAVSGGLRDPAAELALGRLYVETANAQKAIDTLQLFLLGTPGYPEALTLLGRAYEDAGRYGDAIDTVKPMLSGPGDDNGTRQWIAGLYEKSGRWKDAAGAWGELATRMPADATLPVRQAAALVNAGDHANAVQVLERAAAAAPQASAIQAHLGDLYFQLKRYRDAVASYDRALAGDRHDIDVAAVTTQRDRARALAGGA